MGSVAYGLGQIGTEVAGAKELQRKEAIERIKQALEQQKVGIEQGNLGVSKQYVGMRGRELGLEESREARLKQQYTEESDAKLRASRDREYLKGLLGRDPTSEELQRFAKIAPPVKVGAIKQVQDPTSPTGWSWQAVDESTGAVMVNQKGAPPPASTMESVSDTTQTVQLDTPEGPKLVQVPKTTVTHKVPVRGGGSKTPAYAKPGDTNITQSKKDLGLPAGSKILGAKPRSASEVKALIDPVQDADRRYGVMLDAAQHPNPQNDVAMVFNHIGMTLSSQRGARVTNAEIERAITSRSLPENLLASYTKTVNGQFLTPPERKNMLELAVKNRQLIWQAAWEKARAEKMADKLPRTLPGLPPVAGVHYTGEDVLLKTGGKARIVSINPDGSYEVKPY